MPISKGLIPNTILCLIPKVLLQCHIFRHSMPNSKGLPTPILSGGGHFKAAESGRDRAETFPAEGYYIAFYNKRLSFIYTKMTV